jgi:hypothetical protein
LWAHQSGGFLTEDVPDEALNASPALGDAPALESGPMDELRHDDGGEPVVAPAPSPAKPA